FSLPFDTPLRRSSQIEAQCPVAEYHEIASSRSPLSLLARGRGTCRRAAGVEIVPIQDRVEAEEEVALRLPTPVRTVGEHDDVPLADRRVDRDGAASERVAADEHTR